MQCLYAYFLQPHSHVFAISCLILIFLYIDTFWSNCNDGNCSCVFYIIVYCSDVILPLFVLYSLLATPFSPLFCDVSDIFLMAGYGLWHFWLKISLLTVFGITKS